MVATKLITVDEFMAIDEPGRFDLIDGEVVVSPSSFKNSKLAFRLGSRVAAFVDPRSLGAVTGADGGYQLWVGRGTVLCPDVGFVGAARVAVQDQGGFFPGPPDLAVEVISPSETGPMVARKVRLYLEAGCRIVWCVYPDQRTVVVHASGVPPRTLREGDTLDGGVVLPGLTISVAEIFA
ncbi:MAG: Uma2 family endonuclease [Thermomicrobiales bacterium]